VPRIEIAVRDRACAATHRDSSQWTCRTGGQL